MTIDSAVEQEKGKANGLILDSCKEITQNDAINEITAIIKLNG